MKESYNIQDAHSTCKTMNTFYINQCVVVIRCCGYGESYWTAYYLK